MAATPAKANDAAAAVAAAPLVPRVLEAVILTTFMAIYFLWYNGVGELTAMRGVDYTQYIKLPWDDHVPAWGITILPYVVVYALPVFYVIAVWRAKALDVSFVRRTFFAQCVMITLGYLLFYYVPVSIGPIADPFVARGPANTFEFWTLQFVHKGMSQFCAFPSMHVANVWFDSYAWDWQQLPGRTALRVLAHMQFAATLGTRAHYLLDLPAGVLLAELCARLVLRPLERRNAFASPRAMSPVQLGALLVLPALAAAGMSHLNTLTGWGGISNIWS